MSARARFIQSIRLEFLAEGYDDSALTDDELWLASVCVARRLASGDYDGSPGVPLMPTGLTAVSFARFVVGHDPIAVGALPRHKVPA